MAGRSPSIPVGRIRRGAKLGGLLGLETAKAYATKVANVARSEEGGSAANERRRLEAAGHVAEVLGEMKGGAMKAGQMASLMDFSRLPSGELGAFQARFEDLRDSAPQVAFKDMQKVIERDLGARISDVFCEFDRDAAAAASIGQVYRAKLHDGDGLRDPRTHHRRTRLRARSANPACICAALARAPVRRYSRRRDGPVPGARVGHRMGRGSEFQPPEGGAACDTRPGGRDSAAIFLRLAVPVWSVLGRSPPGNFLVLEDGRVAFLDFGMTKTVPRATIEAELGVLRAGLDRDARGVHAGLATLGFFDPADRRIDSDRLLAHVRALNAWYADDELVTLTPQYVSRLLRDAGDPRSEYWDLMRNETIPADSLFSNRMQGMTLAVIGQLRATANWHRVVCEWLYDSAPSSPLGEADAEFFHLGSARRAA